MLCLYCIGDSQIVAPSGELVRLSQKKATVLLHYLAEHSGRWFRREQLAGFFWPDSGVSQAREHLRKRLHEIRRTLADVGADAIELNVTSVRFFPKTAWWSEAQALRNAQWLATWRHQGADYNTSTDYLGAVELPGCEALQAWLLERRAYYKALLARQLSPSALVLAAPKAAVNVDDRPGRRCVILLVVLIARKPGRSPAEHDLPRLELALRCIEQSGGRVLCATVRRVEAVFGFPATDGKMALRAANALKSLQVALPFVRGAVRYGWVLVDYQRGLVDLSGDLRGPAVRWAAMAAGGEFLMDGQAFSAISVHAALASQQMEVQAGQKIHVCRHLEWLERPLALAASKAVKPLERAFSALLRVAQKHRVPPLFVAGHAASGKSMAIDAWLQRNRNSSNSSKKDKELALLVDGHLADQATPFGALMRAAQRHWPLAVQGLQGGSAADMLTALLAVIGQLQTRILVLFIDHCEWLDTHSQTMISQLIASPPAGLRACLILSGRLHALDAFDLNDLVRVRVLPGGAGHFSVHSEAQEVAEAMFESLDRCQAAQPLLRRWVTDAVPRTLPKPLERDYSAQVRLLAREGLLQRRSASEPWELRSDALWQVVRMSLAQRL